MNTEACIFARGGSKGLSGKNIRDFAGRPLIGWAIEQALALSTVLEVSVSTDSVEIAEFLYLHRNGTKLISKDELQSGLQFKFQERNLLISFHPVTLEPDSGVDQLTELLEALDSFPDIGLIITNPNADTGGQLMTELKEKSSCHFLSMNPGMMSQPGKT